MSNSQRIEPHKVTKPIQLLASWLAGLILVNTGFLMAAASIQEPFWIRGALVIASIVNVPLFLFSIFLLQTKFRPEMQEDSYYHEYLITKDGRNIRSGIEIIPQESQIIVSDENDHGIWQGYSIQLNSGLRGYQHIEKTFQDSGIPISKHFGPFDPENNVASVGGGFTSEQIKQLVLALSKTNITHVNYASDEEKLYQYDKTILVGAFVVEPDKTSIPIQDALEMVNRSDYSSDIFYSELIIASNEYLTFG